MQVVRFDVSSSRVWIRASGFWSDDDLTHCEQKVGRAFDVLARLKRPVTILADLIDFTPQ